MKTNYEFCGLIQWLNFDELTKGTDCTGPKPDGPAMGSESIGLVIPLLLAIRPLETDVQVDVVVIMPLKLLLPFADDKPLPLP